MFSSNDNQHNTHDPRVKFGGKTLKFIIITFQYLWHVSHYLPLKIINNMIYDLVWTFG